MAEVLSVQIRPEDQPYFSPTSMHHSQSSQSAYLVGSTSPYHSARRAHYPSFDRHDHIRSSASSTSPSPATSQAELTDSSSTAITLTPTTKSILSLDTKYGQQEEICFPSYNHVGYVGKPEDLEPPPSPVTDNSYTVPSSRTSTRSTSPGPESMLLSEDDTAVREEPSRHVDYLSHDWREEDIWSSWKHIVSNRKLYGERSRLENACWRTWAKSKYRLKTVSPETLNWLKDCDVTWLYGPLQTRSNPGTRNVSEPCSNISKNNSFLNKKPILKKRSASEVMLQKSLSSSSLLKQAAAALQAQQGSAQSGRARDRSILKRNASDFMASDLPSKSLSRQTTDCFSSRSTSGLQSPESEKKHIRFDDKVEQCIAVDIKEGEDDEDDEDNWAAQDDESSDDDDDVILMKAPKPRRPSLPYRGRSNSNSESKTIAKLPSTTLKYRTDTPDQMCQPQSPVAGTWSPGGISPSPSQETLRPPRSSSRFLLDEDDDGEDISWEPSGAFAGRSDHAHADGAKKDRAGLGCHEGDIGTPSTSLRRTPSGMFPPYDDDDDVTVPMGLFGRVVDTVNTARDIAHVIWNVGWRK